MEVAGHIPKECHYVLETLRDVYHHDAQAREQAMSPEQRLRFHQEQSGPLMKGVLEWLEAQLAEHKTEPNSGLGKAISYLLNHWTKLTLFLRQAHVSHPSTIRCWLSAGSLFRDRRLCCRSCSPHTLYLRQRSEKVVFSGRFCWGKGS